MFENLKTTVLAIVAVWLLFDQIYAHPDVDLVLHPCCNQ